jgi:lipopolysaccharide transport protein LptA
MWLLCSGLARGAAEATISSDELEMQNNGERTIFSGHVVLTQVPYQVRADQMIRTKATGIVDAAGRVVGTWVSPKGENVRVEGEKARYNPSTETVEVWGDHQVGVRLDGEKGNALFHGDRGWVYTHLPGRAKLSGQVTGHVIPSGQ